ncbi:MAG: amidase [Steroidobacteraceae bacterium]
MSDRRLFSVAGLRAAYAAREHTPTQIVAEHLARIDEYDPALKAYIEVDRDRAIEAAAVSDQHCAKGTLRTLEGVPVAVKANIAVTGLGWNAGMQMRRAITAASDAEVVARLRGAGAIVLGTLNMHEAALGATSDNPWFGRAMNPHRLGHTPGGSSGGSAAAVAAGLCVAALGTDTLGSVRIPAAYTGIFGIKPTQGAICSAGLVPVSERFDCIGPLARSLDDLQTVLGTLMKPGELSRPRRLLLLDTFEDLDCEPAVLNAYEHALKLLHEWPCQRITLQDTAAAIRFAAFIVAARELISHLGALREERAQDISPELAFMLGHAESRSEADLTNAEKVLARTRATLRDALTADAVLLTPTTPQAAFLHNPRPPVTQSGFTALANIGGLPALSIPAGLDQNGLPVAVQLVGAPDSEAALFGLGREIDAGLRGYAPPPPNHKDQKA